MPLKAVSLPFFAVVDASSYFSFLFNPMVFLFLRFDARESLFWHKGLVFFGYAESL